MVVHQGEVWWVVFPDPVGAEPGFERPAVIIQGDPLNRSQIRTTLVVPLTSNLKWARFPGNVLLPASITSLEKDSVAQLASLTAVDKSRLRTRFGKLPDPYLAQIMDALDVVLERV